MSTPLRVIGIAFVVGVILLTMVERRPTGGERPTPEVPVRRGTAFIANAPTATPVADVSAAGESLDLAAGPMAEIDDNQYHEPAPPSLPLRGAPTPPPPDEDDRPVARELQEIDGHLQVPFSTLSGFTYVPPAQRPADAPAFPEDVLALDARRVTVRGFMVPLELDGSRVTSFVLVGSQLHCHFGVIPKMNEWIHVTMTEGESSRYLPELPVLVWGELSVGEKLRRGQVASLYRMTATQVEGPREWSQRLGSTRQP